MLFPQATLLVAERPSRQFHPVRCLGTGGAKCGHLLFQDRTSKSGPAAQRSVEGIDRYRRHQQNPCQTYSRVPCRALSRQGKSREEPPEDEISQDRQKPEADHQKSRQTTHEQATDQEIGNRCELERSEEKVYENECDRRRPILAQQGAEKSQNEETPKPDDRRKDQSRQYT
jgi:hypothetical protein